MEQNSLFGEHPQGLPHPLTQWPRRDAGCSTATRTEGPRSNHGRLLRNIRIEGDKRITRLTFAWNEAWVGTKQVRTYKSVGDKLEVIARSNRGSGDCVCAGGFVMADRRNLEADDAFDRRGRTRDLRVGAISLCQGQSQRAERPWPRAQPRSVGRWTVFKHRPRRRGTQRGFSEQPFGSRKSCFPPSADGATADRKEPYHAHLYGAGEARR
jgi:hypothetical protein